MRLLFTLAAALVITIWSTLPVRADQADVAFITAKLTDAAANVSSFVVKMQLNGTTGVGGTITFVRPMRIKSVMKVGQVGVETYVVDGTVYMHSPYAGWQKMTSASAISSAAAFNIASGLKSSHVSVLPDRQADGKPLGAIEIDLSIPAAALGAGAGAAGSTQKLVCTYDKVSYRMRMCASSLMTMTYLKYNDPGNVVELPPDAKNAVPIVITTPGTSVPAPTATLAPAPPGPPSPPTPAATSGPTTAPSESPAPAAASATP